MTKLLESVLSYFVAILFAIAACFMLWFLGITFTRHFAARSWIPVPAEVITHDKRTSHSTSFGSSLPVTSERLVVTYAYVVNGTNYTDDRVDFSFGSDNFSGSRRSRQLAGFRTGKINIYVDPENPANSVYDRSLPGGQIIFALIFLLFPCGIGTMFILAMVLLPFRKAGLSAADRFYMPVLGLLHSLPALYPVIFAPTSVGVGGWIVLAALMLLLGLSLRSIWRRLKDPTIGEVQWGEQLAKTFSEKKWSRS